MKLGSLSRSPRTTLLVLLAVLAALLALSMYRSYSLGQYRTMYDNPIYRWRVSLAVALSELRNPPLQGYIAYRSIADYLNQHGLALIEGEATPMPSIASVITLTHDPDRLEQLLREASTVPIDYDLPPVPIVGNEKGEAAFYYMAFRLFGIHLSALWLFYFLLLTVSSLLFFLAFWRFHLCILWLFVYLIAHFYLVGFASSPYIQTVHNSRFFTVLALLPSLHLFVLLARRQRLTLAAFLLAAGQICLLFFVIFCRLQAAWQPAAVIAVTLFRLPYRLHGRAIWQHRALRGGAREFLLDAWPAAMVVCGAISLVVYQHVSLDHRLYATETKSHGFWDPMLTGTISASPELSELYGQGQERYGDTMGYIIARGYLRRRNDVNSPIAEVVGGQIQINAMKNMGEYNRILEHVFFHIVKKHPWLVLKSFVYQKPLEQIDIVAHAKILQSRVLLVVIGLAAGAGLVIVGIGSPMLERADILAAAWMIPLIGLFSLSVTFILPTVMISDLIMVFLMGLLIAPAYATVGVTAWICRQGRGDSRTSRFPVNTRASRRPETLPVRGMPRPSVEKDCD